MRLRPLTEAECYARCYGGRGAEPVTVVVRTIPLLEPGRSTGRERAFDPLAPFVAADPGEGLEAA